MTGAVDGPPDPLGKEDPETLVLRGRPRPAVRFRRGLIVGIAGAVSIALVTVSWLALEPPSFRRAATTFDSGDDRSSTVPPDALTNVPKSYGDVPRLGPPLPGDLGRAILDQERSQAAPMTSATAASPPPAFGGPSAADIERERAGAARRAARTAGLMVQLGADQASTAPASIADASARPSAVGPPAASVPSDQQHKIAFAAGEAGAAGSHQLVPPPSPWLLSAGTMIPASLVTGLNSDLPGLVVAQVTENIRDSATGRTVLVPQGARLIGKYDSVVAFGQRRALLIWTRLILPNGASLALDQMPATDSAGYAGIADGVDAHTWQLLKGIAMSTLLGIGTQLSFGSSGNDLVHALRESAQENVARAGDRITAKNLDIQPTITVRPGWPVRAMVNKDLILEPWRG